MFVTHYHRDPTPVEEEQLYVQVNKHLGMEADGYVRMFWHNVDSEGIQTSPWRCRIQLVLEVAADEIVDTVSATAAITEWLTEVQEQLINSNPTIVTWAYQEKPKPVASQEAM